MTETETLEQYKARVRAEAIRVAEEQGWCDDGLNDALRTLGLKEKRAFYVPFEYTVTKKGKGQILVTDAESEQEAYELVKTQPERVKQQYGSAIDDYSVPEPPVPPKMPEAGSGVPMPGDACPEDGVWYATSIESGGPNQCRVRQDGGVYCTRGVGHTPDWHVAAGKNAGVIATWEAQEGDVRTDGIAAKTESAIIDDDEDEYVDDDED